MTTKRSASVSLNKNGRLRKVLARRRASSQMFRRLLAEHLERRDMFVASLSIADTLGTEGGTASFAVTLSEPVAQQVSVNFSTLAGTALATSDFTPFGGTLTFEPNEVTKNIVVSLIDDALGEFSESFSLQLTGPTGATLADGEALAIVTDDDLTPTAAISGPSVAVPGMPLTFQLSVSNLAPNVLSQVFTYNIDWEGDGIVDTTVQGPGTGRTIDYRYLVDIGTKLPTVTATIGADTTSEASMSLSLVRIAVHENKIHVGGSPGDDRIVYSTGPNGTASIRYNSALMPYTSIPTGGHVIVYGIGGDDTITVYSSNPLTLIESYGDEGNDYLAGGGLNDILVGGAGTDRLLGADGADFLDGGDGNDTINGGAGNDVIYGGAGGNTIGGDSGNDIIHGGNESENINGGGGADILFGGGGDDDLGGGADNDILIGGPGDDFGSSDGGRDIIIGGLGDDYGYGSAGEELFVASYFIYENDLTILHTISSLWWQSTSIDDRIASLTPYFNSTTVPNDCMDDQLTPQGGSDWSIYHTGDTLQHLTGDRKTLLSPFTIDDLSVQEGSPAEFIVSMTCAATQAYSLNYTTVAGSATAGLDFTPVSGTLNFAAGETTKVVLVPVAADLLDETAETFQLTLNNGSFDSFVDNVGNATIIENSFERLVEDSRFRSAFTLPYAIQAGDEAIAFNWQSLTFDTSSAGMRDALEIALLNEAGEPVVGLIQAGRDASFNLTDGQPAVMGGGVAYDAEEKRVVFDVRHLSAGQTLTLVVRLINNDNDTTSKLLHFGTVESVPLPAELVADVFTSAPGQLKRIASVDFAQLSNAMSSIQVEYGRTTYSDTSGVLTAEVSFANHGTHAMRGPMIVAIRNISQPFVAVHQPDGYTPEGWAYFDITDSAVTNPTDFLMGGESTSPYAIAFHNPRRVQFDYDLVVLADVNDTPAFTSEPVHEVIAGKPYAYASTAVDGDNDALTYSLLVAPPGLSIGSLSGELTWSPAAGEVGNHFIKIRATDPAGAFADQAFTLTVRAELPNRPPVFTSTPIVDAYVGTAYAYQATARDADGDSLIYSALSGPQGFQVSSTGQVTWANPSASIVNQLIPVEVKVDDQHGGITIQPYFIRLHPTAGNHAPEIISTPKSTFTLPTFDLPASFGNIDPQQLLMALAPGQQSIQSVTYTHAPQQAPTADIVVLMDVSGSMGTEWDWAGPVLETLNQQLQNRGIGNNRFSLVGFNNQTAFYSTNEQIVPIHIYDRNGTRLSTVQMGINNLEGTLIGEFDLPADGDFYVVVGDGASSGPSGYSFYAQAAATTTTSTSLSLGQSVDKQLSSTREVHEYTFTLSQATSLVFDALRSESTKWSLREATLGTIVDNRSFNQSEGVSRPGNSVLTEVPAGSYTLSIRSDHQGGSSYAFRLLDIAASSDISINAVVTTSFASTRESKLYEFVGTAGQQIYIDLMDSTSDFYGYWRLLDPRGNVVRSNQIPGAPEVAQYISTNSNSSAPAELLGDQPTFALPLTGTYTLLMEGNATSSISSTTARFQIVAEDLSTAPLVLGTETQGSISQVGAMDNFTFTLSQAQILHFDAQSASIGEIGYSQARWRLQGLQGVVFDEAFPDQDKINLLPAGTYTLSIDPTEDATGAYSFAVEVFSGSTGDSMSFGVQYVGEFDPPGVAKVFRFNATAGDHFEFEALAPSTFYTSAAIWQVIDSFGQEITTTYQNQFQRSFTAPSTGDYWIAVSAPSVHSDDWSYALTLDHIGNTPVATIAGTALSFNQVQSVAASGTPSTDRYQFTVSQSGGYYLDVLASGSGSWILRGLQGVVASYEQLGPETYRERLMQLPAGSYELAINHFGDAYQFQLVELATAVTALTAGSATPAVLNPSSQVLAFSLDVSAAGEYYFDIDWTGDGGSWNIVDQYGRFVDYQTLSGDWNSSDTRLRFPTAGIYTLLLTGYSTTSVTEASVNFVAITTETQTIDIGAVVSDSLDVPGQRNRYEFVVAQDAQLMFESFTQNSALRWSLEGYSGVLSSDRDFVTTDLSSNANPFIDLEPGIYSITVWADSDAVIPHSFRLLDVAAAATIAFNSQVFGASGDTYKAYSFLGQPGQRLHLDAEPNQYQSSWYLYDAIGRKVAASSSSLADLEIALPLGGKYTFITRNAEEAFSLREASSESEQLALNSVVTAQLARYFDEQTYEFTLAQESLVLIDFLTEASSVNWRLKGPQGADVFESQPVYSDSGNLLRILPAGEYSLTLRLETDSAANVELVVSDVSATSSALTLGQSFTVNLPTGYETIVSRFAATGGDQISLTALIGPSSGVALRLFDPIGREVQSFYEASSNEITLPLTGDYYVLMSSQSPNANQSLGATIETVGQVAWEYTGISVAWDQAISDSFLPGETERVYTFSGERNQLLLLDFINQNGLSVTLDSPGHTQVTSTQAVEDLGAIPLTQTGTYRLTVHRGASSDPFTFRLKNLGVTTAVGIDGLVSGEMAGNGQANAYRGSGNAGERIVLRQRAWQTATEIQSAFGRLTNFGSGTEDGYHAIHKALSQLTPREGSQFHVVLITDEDHTSVDGNVTYASLLGQLNHYGATLHTINALNLTAAPINGNTTGQELFLGIDGGIGAPAPYYFQIPDGSLVPSDFRQAGQGSTYALGPDGTFSLVTTPNIAVEPAAYSVTQCGIDFCNTSWLNRTPVTDYTRLALDQGGSVWSLGAIRGNQDQAQSLANAFAYSLAERIEADSALSLVSSDPDAPWQLLGVEYTETGAVFTVQFTGDGLLHQFALNIVPEADSSTVLGTIPMLVWSGFLYDANAVDADGDALTYQLTGETHGATIDPASGKLNWTPSALGDYEFEVLVTDGHGGEARQRWSVSVVPPSANQSPVLTAIPAQEVELGRSTTILATAVDGDGDQLTYQLIHDPTNGMPVPTGMAIDALTGVIDWSPGNSQLGQHQVRVRVSDAFGNADEELLSLNVVRRSAPINKSPTIVSSPVIAAAVSDRYDYQVSAVDADGDSLSYALIVAPEGMAIDPATGRIAWTPAYGQVGAREVVLAVRDSLGALDYQAFSISVANINDAPVISSVPQDPALVNAPWEYQVVAIDPNGDVLKFSLDPVSIARGMTISNDGVLSWTPGALGTVRVIVKADDQRGGTATQEFTLKVKSVAPPVFTSGLNPVAFLGSTYTSVISADDPDAGDTLQLAIDNLSLARGMQLTPTAARSWLLTWTPTATDTVPIILALSDSQGFIVSKHFDLTVLPAVVTSSPPQFTTVPTGPAIEGIVWEYVFDAVDADNPSSSLVYTLHQPKLRMINMEVLPHKPSALQ